MSTINPMKLMQIKQAWNRFTANHPKFPMFIQAITSNQTIKPDTIIEITITTPEGKNYSTNIKVKEDDMELMNILS